MAGPWEKYQAAPAEGASTGAPWEKYQTPATPETAPVDDGFGYGDALRRGVSSLANVGSLVPYGYAKMYEPLTDLFAGEDGVNPVTQWTENELVNQFENYQSLPSDPRLAGFAERVGQGYDEDGVGGAVSAMKPESFGDLFSGLDAGAKLLVGELPGLVVGGGVGGRVVREAADPIVSRIANEAAQSVAGKAATGVGVQAGAVAIPSTSANVSENLQDGMTTEEAILSGLKQAGVEAAVNAPAGAIAPFNIGGPLRNAATQGIAQTGAGVGGAIAGAEAVGKDIGAGEVALEGLFGLASVPVDVAVSKFLAARDNGVSVDEVTPEMEAAANQAEARQIAGEIERLMTEGQLRPEEVGPLIEELTGQTAPPALDRSTIPGRQAARQREAELGSLFEGTDILPRQGVQPTPEGTLDIAEGTMPVRDPIGRQAAPETFGPQSIANRTAQELGVTLTPEDMQLAARDIAADPTADPRSIVRDYSIEGRDAAFRQAEARKRRRDTDLDADLRPEPDYRAGAGRSDDLSPRMRQELEADVKRPPRGVNEGQPGQPRESVDRITSNMPGPVRGELIPGQQPRQPAPESGRDFEGTLSDRIAPQPNPDQPRVTDQSGIGRREQVAREADRQGRFEGKTPNEIRDYQALARAADRAESAIDQSNLSDTEKQAAKAQVDSLFNGDGDSRSMPMQDAARAIDEIASSTRRTEEAPQADPDARPQPEPEVTPEPEPEARAQPDPQPEPTPEPEAQPEAQPEPQAEATPDSEYDAAAGRVEGGKVGIIDDDVDFMGDPSAKESEIVSKAMKGKGPIEFAKWLSENAPSKAHRAIASAVEATLKRMARAGVDMTLVSSRKRREGLNGYTSLRIQQVRAPDGSKELEFSIEVGLKQGKGTSYGTALHELVHAATQMTTFAAKQPIYRGTELAATVKELDTLHKAVRNRLAQKLEKAAMGGEGLNKFEQISLGRGGRNNAFDNIDELLAWGMSSPDMQRFLEAMPYEKGTGWTKFVSIVRKALKLPVKQNTALSELLRLAQRLGEQDMQDVVNKLEETALTGGFKRGMEVTSEQINVNDNADGVSKDPDFKPSKIAEAIKGIAGKEARAFDFSSEQISRLLETIKESAGGLSSGSRATKRSIMTDAWRTVFASLDGDMRVLTGKFKSDTLKGLPDMFHAKAGQAKGVMQTFDEAVQARNSKLRDVDTLVSFMRDNGIKTTDQQAQVIKLVENPRTPRRGAIGEAANKIAAFLKDELEYLREAGVELGEVGDGYFPREVDKGKAEADPDKFIRAATKAYKETGLSDEAAADAARSYWESTVYGVSGKPGFQPRGGQTPSFVQGRVFTKAAANHLADFRVKDIDAVLGQYTMRATRRAEIARRFGDNWSEWPEIEKKILAEDPDAMAILPDVRDRVALSAGVNMHSLAHGARVSLSMLRTWSTLAVLPKAAMASLGELVVAPLRGATGSIPGDMAIQLTNIWDHMYNTTRTMSGLGRDQKLQAAFELAEDIGIIAGTGHNSLMAARFAGGDPVGRLQSDVLASFFRRNQLEHLTNYTRVTSMKNAQVFMRRLSKQMEANPDRAAVFLRELGIPEGREAEFATWMLSQDVDNPSPVNLKGEFANMYRTGLQRFVDQTVMRPSQSTRPKWATHPLGAVLFQLQAFGYAFQKNVLNRQGNLLKELNNVDRLAYSVSMLSGFALLIGVQGMFRYLRDEIYNEEVNDRKTTAAFVEGAFSQAGMFGVADPYLQALTGVRYQKSISSMFMGPALGGVVSTADAMLATALNNSDNTNTAERNLAKSGYDWLIEPALQASLTFAPGGPLTGPIASFTTIYAIPKLRDPFADVVAGEATSTRKKTDIEGMTDWLIGDDSNSDDEIKTRGGARDIKPRGGEAR